MTIWLWKILLHGKNNLPYNVGSDAKITISKLAHCVAEIAGSLNNEGLQEAPKTMPSCRRGASMYVPETHRITSEMKLSKTTSLEESIEKTLNYAHLCNRRIKKGL
jgi:dTDP-D-glucose 4,6-dehydratase